MKKRIALLVTVVACLCMLFTGCGKKTGKKTSDGIEITKGTPAIEDCVKVPNWKGIKVKKSVAEVTEKEIESYALAQKEPKDVKDANAKVKNGDTVNIDYEGKVDGKKFDGGSAKGVDLIIGSGSFIAGFEDGIVGMKAGDENTIKVTFPKNYTEELAGKEASFKIKVNSIKRADKPTDKDLKQAEEALRESKASDAEYSLKDQVWSYINNNAEWKAMPQEYLDKYGKEYDKSILTYSKDIESYLKDNGVTKKEYNKEKKEYSENSAKNYMLGKALQKTMKIKESSKEYKKAMKELAQTYGMSEKELKESYGEEALNNYVLYQVEVDKMVKEAKVVDESKKADK